MTLPITVETAFKNAEERNQINPVKIYMCFKRSDIYYKDTYYILTGMKEEVEMYIRDLYQEIEKFNKNEDIHEDFYGMSDTPFDTFCNEWCLRNNEDNPCSINELDKCASHWISKEYNTQEELNNFINNIPYIYSYYNYYHIIYMNNPTTYENYTKASNTLVLNKI
jgi:hypothetical protein